MDLNKILKIGAPGGTTQSSTVPHDKIDDIKPTPAEIALAMLAHTFGAAEVVRAAAAWKTVGVYQAYIGDLAALSRDLPSLSVTEERLRKMALFSATELKNAAVTFQYTRHYVCPFNVAHHLVLWTGYYLSSDDGVKKTFSTGVGSFVTNWDSEESLYRDAGLLFKGTERVLNRTSYEIAPFDPERREIAIMLSYFCNYTYEGGVAVLSWVDRVTPEPHIHGLLAGVYLFLKAFANVIYTWLEKNLKHWFTDQNDAISVLYANIDMDVIKQLLVIMDPDKPQDLINGYEYYAGLKSSPESGWGQFYEKPTAEQADLLFARFEKGEDEYYGDAKQVLEDTKSFVTSNPDGAEYTADLCMPFRVFHMKESHWGIGSKLAYLDQAMNLLGAPPASLFLYGQGSDRVGFGLEKAKEFDFFPYKVDGTTIPLYITGNSALRAVPNAINSYPPDLLEPGSIQLMYEFPNHEAEYVTHLEAAYDRMEWDATKPSVLACSHNLCSTVTFTTVIDFAERHNLYYTTWRHPRYNNDHYCWFFTNGRGGCSNDQARARCLAQVSMDRIVMEKQIIENNRMRNGTLVSGWYPKMPKQSILGPLAQYILKIDGLTMLVVQYYKQFSKLQSKSRPAKKDFFQSRLNKLDGTKGSAYNNFNSGTERYANKRPSATPAAATSTTQRDGDNNNNAGSTSARNAFTPQYTGRTTPTDTQMRDPDQNSSGEEGFVQLVPQEMDKDTAKRTSITKSPPPETHPTKKKSSNPPTEKPRLRSKITK